MHWPAWCALEKASPALLPRFVAAAHPPCASRFYLPLPFSAKEVQQREWASNT